MIPDGTVVSVRIALLGELEVQDDDGRGVAVPGAKLRSLLAILALNAGRVVAAEQLVDALWGEEPPPAVRNSLQGLVSRLRRALGSDVVAMRSGGYVLDVRPDEIDVHRFEQLVAEARDAAQRGETGNAVETLVAAASLWRGDALAEFIYEDFAASEIGRLSELRLAALEMRLDLELELGRHHAVVSELEALVAAHPLRERLRGLLMLALYRAGRQADALRVFQDGRTVLAEELGLEPSPELRRLEAAILAQDETLAAPAIDRAPAAPATKYTVPSSLTPLVGRARELTELAHLVAEQRLVTLVGPGGVGKTRLALEVARRAALGTEHGACLVELAPVGDPAGVAAAVAAALDLPDPTRLAEGIGDRELLLVLDNCEHVIGSAAGVAEELLRRCPGLRLLATSREGLRVGGEAVWPVPPLQSSDAIELFFDRAVAAGSSMPVDDDVSSVVAEICARLDGLPLAIELAAARTRAFPLHQIAARLNDRFRLLTGGARTALPRQQTLRAVVDWSYELLFDDEQKVFERLSVFPGGCDLPTAEAVCADEDIAPDDLADIIQALVDKSLVVAAPVAGDMRFTQLQTLAQYGREKLAERGDSERIRDAMARHYAHLCARSAEAYIGDEQRSWLVAIDQEQDNLRAALEWAVTNNDAETALTIAGGAAWAHWLAGTSVEGKRWLDDAFRCTDVASDHTRALALTGRGLLDFQTGAQAGVDGDFENALTVFRAEEDFAATVLAQSFLTEVAATRGDLDEAIRRRRASIELYESRPVDDFVGAAVAYSRGKLAVLEGDLESAAHHYREAAAGFFRIDRPMMLSISLALLSDFEDRAGDHAAAVRALERAVELNDELRLRGFNSATLARLGWSLLQLGDLGRAEAVYARALDLARRLTHTAALVHALTGLAAVHRTRGRNDEARAAATEALALYETRGHPRMANRIDPRRDSVVASVVNHAVLAVIAGESGDVDGAAHDLAEVDRLCSAEGVEVPGFLRDDIADLRSSLLAASR